VLSLLLITVSLTVVCGVAWHDKSARGEPSALNRLTRTDRE
jgi:hypothetical protein